MKRNLACLHCMQRKYLVIVCLAVTVPQVRSTPLALSSSESELTYIEYHRLLDDTSLAKKVICLIQVRRHAGQSLTQTT